MRVAARAEAVLWRTYSHVYDGLLNFWPYTNLLEAVFDQADLPRRGRLLDLGCGTGNFLARVLRDASTQLDLVGVDSSVPMLRKAERKLQGRPHVDLIVDSAVDFMCTQPSGSVDRVVSVNALYAEQDRDAFWAELVRVLAPDGRAVITTSTTARSSEIIGEHLRHASLFKLLAPRLLAVGAIDLIIQTLGAAHHFNFVSQQTLTKEIVCAGGHVVATRRCYGGDNGANIIVVVTREGLTTT